MLRAKSISPRGDLPLRLRERERDVPGKNALRFTTGTQFRLARLQRGNEPYYKEERGGCPRRNASWRREIRSPRVKLVNLSVRRRFFPEWRSYVSQDCAAAYINKRGKSSLVRGVTGTVMEIARMDHRGNSLRWEQLSVTHVSRKIRKLLIYRNSARARACACV